MEIVEFDHTFIKKTIHCLQSEQLPLIMGFHQGTDWKVSYANMKEWMKDPEIILFGLSKSGNHAGFVMMRGITYGNGILRLVLYDIRDWEEGVKALSKVLLYGFYNLGYYQILTSIPDVYRKYLDLLHLSSIGFVKRKTRANRWIFDVQKWDLVNGDRFAPEKSLSREPAMSLP